MHVGNDAGLEEVLEEADVADLGLSSRFLLPRCREEKKDCFCAKRRRASVTAEGSSRVIHSGGGGSVDGPASLDMANISV